jgi:hypothetical protein
MMSEEMFFNKVKETMHGYAPEVPASVYGGMRKKYARSKFFSWNASTFNAWYVALIAIAGLITFTALPTNEMKASKASTINMNVEHLPASVASTLNLETAIAKSCEQTKIVSKNHKGEPSLMPSSLVEVKKESSLNQNLELTQSSAEGTTPKEEVITTESSEVVLPVEEKKEEAAPKKPTRKIKAPIYKDKQ